MVPVLESPDGNFLCESKVIAEFAQDLQPDKGIPLWPHSTKPGDQAAIFKTAQHKLQMEKFNGMLSKTFWPAMMAKWADGEQRNNLKAALPEWETFFTTNLATTPMVRIVIQDVFLA